MSSNLKELIRQMPLEENAGLSSLTLIHISETTSLGMSTNAVF